METIKVNMSPNPLDVQTIHASQNDNEAREWGFELHNNGEKIDSSSISDQMVFKAYEGGTEEILPTNGSTPTTSPFKGDIKYPQGLLTDQEFLYRESPTEEDGLAKITDIKGNTLVWNQLVQNGNFESTDGWRFPNGTASVSNNVLTVNATESSLQIMRSSNYTSTQGHKIYISCWIKSSVAKNDVRLRISQDNPLVHTQYISKNLDANVRTNISGIITAESNTTNTRFSIFVQNSASGEVYTVDSFVAFDLTQMGLDITEPSEFTSLFPLSYYDYNQGSLLSFNGNGIKTVGKNQLNPSDVVGLIGSVSYSDDTYTITYSSSGDRYVGMNFYRRGIPLDKLLPKKYTLSFDISGVDTAWAIGLRNATNNSFLNNAVISLNSDGHYSLTIDFETINQTEYYLSFVRAGNKTTPLTVLISNVMLELGNTESVYEPYTSNTTSLPISTYFPTGMKSAGNAYDELTPTKAITRIGAVDLGSLNWYKEEGTYITGGYCFTASSDSPFLPQVKKPSSNLDVGNILCGKYQNLSQFVLLRDGIDKTICLGTGTLRIIDKSYTDATSFKTAMSGVYLYYELATPTETSFTTASLVTENGEIPLSNEDGVLVGKCTEQLSENPGFIDAKIKLSDGDGECYSNKIQLHVERSPQ